MKKNFYTKCCVVIPVYKEQPDKYEIHSLEQCLDKLKSYDIFLVTFSKLKLDLYKDIFNAYNLTLNTIFFPEEYFANLKGYNTLMLSSGFYKKFINYDYILIYQLDCYVFKDELDFWCKKGYDYIGAPWFTDNTSYEEGGKLWKVGNGGLSLRKVEKFINILNYKKNIYTLKRAYKINKANHETLFNYISMIFFGKNNRIKEILNNWDDAEDIFFCLVLENTKLKLHIPEAKEAMKFAFEKSPKHLYSLNQKELPFGCHAWKKYQHNEFWESIIKYEK